MSGSTYLDADTLADARNALGFGVPVEQIAGRVGVEVSELQRALGLPEWKIPDSQEKQLELDLWAADRLDGIL
ncbi:MAG: hypothetical protein R3C20_00220 [Planctomycetaceae bacterium]